MTYDDWLAEILRRADRRTMPNDLIMQLDYIGGLLKDIDSIRDRVKELLAGGNDQAMTEAKFEATKAGSALFDALVDYQRALLNGPYNPKAGRAIHGKVGEAQDA